MKTDELLRLIRRKTGLSQKKLGIKLGISQASVGNWELGIRTPTLSHWIKIMKIASDYNYIVSVDAIFSAIKATKGEKNET